MKKSATCFDVYSVLSVMSIQFELFQILISLPSLKRGPNNGLEPKNLNDPEFGFRSGWALRVQNWIRLALKIKNHLEIIKSDCIFRRPGNWNVDSIRQTLDSADLIVSPGCNSSRNGSSGFSSGRDEWILLFFRYPDTWISILHILFVY